MINKFNIIKDNCLPVFPRRVINKCPAIIFAANRTAKVPGRITFLIVSIQTMKGINAGGVPWGTKCANIWIVLLIHPKIIKLIQRGKANVNVIDKCLVLVNTYGNNPKKLLNKIIENSEMKIRVLPFILGVPIKILNSVWSVLVILFHKIEEGDGINQ